METGTLITIIVVSLIFILGLGYFISQAGRGSSWED